MKERQWRRYGSRKPIKWFRGKDRDSDELFDFDFWADDLMDDKSDRVACNSLKKIKDEIKIKGWKHASICDVNDKLPVEHDGFITYSPKYRKYPN